MKKNPNKQPAVFIDRDGTLIEEVNYLSTVEDTRLFPFTAEAIGLLRQSGFLVIVVTNQSGIGRNIYDEAAMHSIHEHLQAELSQGIDAFYYCPHLPCDGCTCRKPGLGMIDAARRDFEIDMGRSWMIGDKHIDVETGQNAGISKALVLTGYGQSHEGLLDEPADLISDNLLAAARAIVELAAVKNGDN